MSHDVSVRVLVRNLHIGKMFALTLLYHELGVLERPLAAIGAGLGVAAASAHLLCFSLVRRRYGLHLYLSMVAHLDFELIQRSTIRLPS